MLPLSVGGFSRSKEVFLSTSSCNFVRFISSFFLSECRWLWWGPQYWSPVAFFLSVWIRSLSRFIYEQFLRTLHRKGRRQRLSHMLIPMWIQPRQCFWQIIGFDALRFRCLLPQWMPQSFCLYFQPDTGSCKLLQFHRWENLCHTPRSRALQRTDQTYEKLRLDADFLTSPGLCLIHGCGWQYCVCRLEEVSCLCARCGHILGSGHQLLV